MFERPATWRLLERKTGGKRANYWMKYPFSPSGAFSSLGPLICVVWDYLLPATQRNEKMMMRLLVSILTVPDLTYVGCAASVLAKQSWQQAKSKLYLLLVPVQIRLAVCIMDSLPMPLLDYKRYGRQMILDGFGLDGSALLVERSIL